MHAPSDFKSSYPLGQTHWLLLTFMTTHVAQVTVSGNVTTIVSGNNIHDYTYTKIQKLHLTLTEHSF